MRATTRIPFVERPISTPDGTFIARYTEQGLTGLCFPARDCRTDEPRTELALPTKQLRRWHALTERALEQALAGRVPRQLPPFDLSAGTAFQQAVWTALREIALGQTRTYRDIAQAIGRPRAARAVGGACGANPIPVLIPCHRVLASGGGLGGFGGGLEWKRTLLEREGSLPSPE